MDPDDLIQDAYELFYKCVDRYADSPRCQNRANFIALFKSALFNYMTTLGKRNVRMPEKLAGDLVEDETTLFDAALPPEEDFVELQVHAPEIIRRLLVAMEADVRKLRAPYRVRKNGSRETTNERLCRLVGVDPKSMNLAAELRNYLAN